MKKRNKGFTLVELIVVLVILAILAAILVPALLGYIDKAREKQVTTNAESAYVAAQARATEYYGKNSKANVTAAKCRDYILGKDDGYTNIQTLTDIGEQFTIEDLLMVEESSTGVKENCIIKQMTYVQSSGDKKATWYNSATNVTLKDGTTQSVDAGGWVVDNKN